MMPPLDLDAIKKRHLDPERNRGRTYYEGHIEVDLAALVEEVEHLRAERDHFREAWAKAQVRLDCGVDATDAVRGRVSKYVTFTGLEAAPEPPVCPECKGKCCRDDYGYRVEHMGAEYYEHWCEHCYDGTVPEPVWTAEQERAAVVAWLWGQSVVTHDYAGSGNSTSDTYVAAAKAVERGDHRRSGGES